MSSRMSGPETAGTPVSSSEVGSSNRRFPCPSCGSSLREGAILCPFCDSDFRTPAASAPGSEIQAHPIWGGPRPDASPEDRRLARLSLIIAATALVADVIVLPILAWQWRASPQLSLLLLALTWGATLSAVYAIHLARRAVRRIDNTQDKRGLMTAQYGLMLAWAEIAWTVFTLFVSPVNLWLRVLPH
jgi:hypothetical protein